MTEEKTYTASFRLTMPGQQKENEYSITVKADDPVDAMIKARAEWDLVTEPRDVRVKEIPSKESSKIQVGS